MRSAWGSPEVAANPNNTLNLPGYSGHLSNKAKYFWPMGDRYRQVPQYHVRFASYITVNESFSSERAQ